MIQFGKQIQDYSRTSEGKLMATLTKGYMLLINQNFFFFFCNVVFPYFFIFEDIQHALVEKGDVNCQLKKCLNPDCHASVLVVFNKKSLQYVVSRFFRFFCLIGNKGKKDYLEVFQWNWKLQ